MSDWPSQWLTVGQIAELVCDDVENIQGFVRENKIPYWVFPDGLLIPLYGFQLCMLDLYDLAGALESIYRAIGREDV